MYAQRETYFGWTSRRVPLYAAAQPTASPVTPAASGPSIRPEDESVPSGVTLDRILPESVLHGRLVAYHDADEDRDYVAVAVGAVAGENDVPVRVAEEETLVVSAARSVINGILVGTEDDDLDELEVARQLRFGGPVRDLLEYIGARSVVVDWSPAVA
ncbi:hypothetical protein [Rhodococcus rhodochrous]|uniref:hypothetical protein n=1 Tax=Rhodococcus rhodochrous TaxID=1829 RepID=UPI0003156E97|nr:hypothetical protein [Rhodococcus rhodochrous]